MVLRGETIEQIRTAKALCEKYIRPGGISEIAISAQMRDNIITKIDAANITESLFDPAQKACLLHIETEILPHFVTGWLVAVELVESCAAHSHLLCQRTR